MLHQLGVKMLIQSFETNVTSIELPQVTNPQKSKNRKKLL